MNKSNLHPEYIKNSQNIQLCLPIETDVLIPVRHSVRLLDQVLDELDYRPLYQTYAHRGRKPVTHPKNLFKVLVYAYSQGIYSSRKIEDACRLNLAFQYLLRGDNIPDHNTIARFRTGRLGDCIELLLNQLVHHLSRYEAIDFDHVFIDGTKIEANANRYSFVWKKATTQYEARLQLKIYQLLSRCFAAELLPEIMTSERLEEYLTRLEARAKKEAIVFVHGKGRRKTPLQRDIEALRAYLETQEKYERYHLLFKGRNSFSKTDPDATFMRLKDDHMRNAQLKPAYNLQLAVAHEYIVGVDVSCERSDTNTLKPFLQRMKHDYGRPFDKLVCDAGYESEENYTYLAEEGITAYIKPSNYEYSKTRKFQRDQAFRLSLEYLPQQDAYRCLEGRLLTFSHIRTRKSASGFESESKLYRCESCEGCSRRATCYTGKYSKQLQVAETFEAYRKESLRNVTSPLGIKLRVNRSIQVEGAFGVLKWNHGFKRFLTRGVVNVKTECLLLAFGFNINKLHHRIQGHRLRQALFPLKDTG